MRQSKTQPGNKYIHLNIGDVLMLCMEDSSVAPIQQLVESLIVIGPESLALLREILMEASKRKIQVMTDEHQVMEGLRDNLANYGVALPVGMDATGLIRIRASRFHSLLRQYGVSQETYQVECLQLLQDTRDLLIGLQIKQELLGRIEEYLEDWTWSLFYMSSRNILPGSLHIQ
jgi:hypothetical protein